jgi:alpha-1,2-mannosyltransferase
MFYPALAFYTLFDIHIHLLDVDILFTLNPQPHVEFRLNAPYDELLHWLSISSIGISTMVEEHFGIGVVEFMVRHCADFFLGSPGPFFGAVPDIQR